MSDPSVGPERHQNLGVRCTQDVGDLGGRQHRVHRVGHARGLRAEQRHEGLRQQRQQQAHHITARNAQAV